MKQLRYFLMGIGVILLCGAVGDVFDSLMINPTSGVVQNSIVTTWSNQLIVTTAPTVAQHAARLQDITNGFIHVNAITNLIAGDGISITGGAQVKTNAFSGVINSSTIINSRTLIQGGALTVSNSTYLTGGLFLKTVITGTNYIMTTNDNILLFNLTSGGASVSATLPPTSQATNGYMCIIKDFQRLANTTNIHVVAGTGTTIDSAISSTISSAGGSLRIGIATTNYYTY